MLTEPELDLQRVEFRVMCRYTNGSELTWNTTDTLEDAIGYINELTPRLRSLCDWIVYEVRISEFAGIVYEVRRTAN
jgi:hypothetical protein